MVVTKNYINRLLNMRNSIIGKVIILFSMMFVLLLIPVVVQSVTSFQQARAYRDIINNIIYVNQLNMDVSEEIAPAAWNIVAGKVSFEESEILLVIENLRTRMLEIRNNASSAEDHALMETSLRALATLENYLLML